MRIMKLYSCEVWQRTPRLHCVHLLCFRKTLLPRKTLVKRKPCFLLFVKVGSLRAGGGWQRVGSRGASVLCSPQVFSFSLHIWLFETPWTVACQAPPSMDFSRQEYWNGLPCSPPRDLPNTGTKPRSPALQGVCLPSEPPGKPHEALCTMLKMGAWYQSDPDLKPGFAVY